MPLVELERLAGEIRKMYSVVKDSPPGIRFTGGEPFIYPHLYEALELFDFAPEIHITTNGLLVRDEDVRKLSMRTNTSLIVSVYPDLPNGQIRNDSILKKLLGSGLKVIPTLVVNKALLRYLPRIHETLFTWGATQLVINGMAPGGLDPDKQARLVLDFDDIQWLETFISSRLNAMPGLNTIRHHSVPMTVARCMSVCLIAGAELGTCQWVSMERCFHAIRCLIFPLACLDPNPSLNSTDPAE